MIFHITTESAWLQAQRLGQYIPAGFDDQGFIHCSRKEQLVAVANRFYHGVPGLVILEIDPEKTEVELRWENLEGGDELFPHLYGALKLDAVKRVVSFPPGKDGKFLLPRI